MSYCRFAWDGSDVYVYLSATSNRFECCGCVLATGDVGPSFATPEEMITHLAAHRRAGHFVPDYAITGLWSEIPGAIEPTTPEPEAFTRAKQSVEEIMKKLKEGGQ
jgi:hypothetical protein